MHVEDGLRAGRSQEVPLPSFSVAREQESGSCSAHHEATSRRSFHERGGSADKSGTGPGAFSRMA